MTRSPSGPSKRITSRLPNLLPIPRTCATAAPPASKLSANEVGDAHDVAGAIADEGGVEAEDIVPAAARQHVDPPAAAEYIVGIAPHDHVPASTAGNADARIGATRVEPVAAIAETKLAGHDSARDPDLVRPAAEHEIAAAEAVLVPEGQVIVGPARVERPRAHQHAPVHDRAQNMHALLDQDRRRGLAGDEAVVHDIAVEDAAPLGAREESDAAGGAGLRGAAAAGDRAAVLDLRMHQAAELERDAVAIEALPRIDAAPVADRELVGGHFAVDDAIAAVVGAQDQTLVAERDTVTVDIDSARGALDDPAGLILIPARPISARADCRARRRSLGRCRGRSSPRIPRQWSHLRAAPPRGRGRSRGKRQ
ncbi:MAG TPA: hypothetical protein VFR34_15125 [Paracoccaceae bacterium]|nr:hypothetical protein [Paracoccaceae bacterium]